jgi:hypothetical protein
MKEKILEWFAHGECGISSKAMACAVIGMKPDKNWSAFGNHPHDPDDLSRCVKLLDAVPEARNHLGKVAKLSKVWARLVEHWDELEAMYRSRDYNQLYDRMKEIGC